MSTSVYKKIYGPFLIVCGLIMMVTFQNCAKGVAVNFESTVNKKMESKAGDETIQYENSQNSPVVTNQNSPVVTNQNSDDNDRTIATETSAPDKKAVPCFYPEKAVVNLVGTTQEEFKFQIKFINECKGNGAISLRRRHVLYNSDQVFVKGKDGGFFGSSDALIDVGNEILVNYSDELTVDRFSEVTRYRSDKKKLILEYYIKSPTGNAPFSITVNADLDFKKGSTRSCLKLPQNASGGVETYEGNGEWGKCEIFSCVEGFISKNNQCLAGCRGDYFSWYGVKNSLNDRCYTKSKTRDLAVGDKVRIDDGKNNYTDITCNDSKQLVEVSPIPKLHDPKFADYLLIEATDPSKHKATCFNEDLVFSGPRIWGSCQSSSTASCYAGNNEITLKETPYKVRFYVDDSFLGKITSNRQSIAEALGTEYKFYAEVKNQADKILIQRTDLTDFFKQRSRSGSLGIPSSNNYVPSPNRHFIDILFQRTGPVTVTLTFEANVNVQKSGALKESKKYTSSIDVKVNGGPDLIEDYDGSGVADVIMKDLSTENPSIRDTGRP